MVNEIGDNINVSHYPNSKPHSYWDNIFNYEFKIGDNNIQIMFSMNPMTSLDTLSSITTPSINDLFNKYTDSEEFRNDGDEKWDKFISRLPIHLKRSGEVSFSVDGNWDTKKNRGEKGGDVKKYLNILNQITGIISKLINKFKPYILIINRPSVELSSDITKKRNNVYEYFIKKHLPQSYSLKEKNNILFIEKKSYQMNEQLKQTLKQVLKEQREEILSFESDPIEYIIQKYPSLDATLIDLLTEVYKDYITGIYVMAPKPTTFKILLHNGHSFYLIYHPRAYICKVSGKKYNLMDLKEEEYAIKAISNLLLLGIPPNSQGPDEEQTNENDFKGGSFVSDMTSEPDLGDIEGDLDDLENTPDGELGGGEEEQEELQEQEEPKKELPKRFRIVKSNK